MAGSFAGARNLDERRRRRLASESDEVVVQTPRRAQAAAPTNVEGVSHEKVASVALFPVRKLISPTVWKHSVVGCLLFGVGSLILAAGLELAHAPEQFGPGFEKLFNFETGRAVSYFSGGLMTLAGQLAFLIWWARSRSLHDYNGSYRVWAWAAMFGGVLGFCLLTDAHIAFSLTVFWMWDLTFWKQDVLCWLAPALVVTGGLFWPLRHDMYESRASRSLFTLAGGCWIVVAVLQIGFEFPGMENQKAAHAAVGMVGALAFYMSMMLHARFVLYETAEAPVVEKKTSLASKTVGVLGKAKGLTKLVPGTAGLKRLVPRLPKRQPVEDVESEETQAKPTAKPPVKAKQTTTVKAKSQVVTEPVESEHVEAEKPKKKMRFRLKSGTAQEILAPEDGQEVEQREEVQQNESEQAAYAMDEQSLQGLSKKERRRIKRQQRKAS